MSPTDVQTALSVATLVATLLGSAGTVAAAMFAYRATKAAVEAAEAARHGVETSRQQAEIELRIANHQAITPAVQTLVAASVACTDQLLDASALALVGRLTFEDVANAGLVIKRHRLHAGAAGFAVPLDIHETVDLYLAWTQIEVGKLVRTQPGQDISPAPINNLFSQISEILSAYQYSLLSGKEFDPSMTRRMTSELNELGLVHDRMALKRATDSRDE